MSQLTVDSQQLDTDDNEQLSQESTKDNIRVQPTEIVRKDPPPNKDDNDVIVYSLNDTPGKEVSAQVDNYNERMNTSFQEYDDTPIQDSRGMSNQRQDSDGSSDDLNQHDLLSIQNRLFYQAASGNQQDNQRQSNTREDQN